MRRRTKIIVKLPSDGTHSPPYTKAELTTIGKKLYDTLYAKVPYEVYDEVKRLMALNNPQKGV